MDVVNPRLDDDVASADETGDADEERAGRASGTGAPDLDLTPRAAPAPRGRGGATNKRRWPWVIVLLAIIVGIGFVVSHAINDATLFFYNTDEAVAKQAELGTKRFRLQGTVVPNTRARTAEGVAFKVTFDGVDVDVNHVGDPPELFRDCVPVVLEGHWSGSGPTAVFASDRILVKHSENYAAANPDRLKEAAAGGLQATPAGGTAACSAAPAAAPAPTSTPSTNAPVTP